MVRDLRPAAVLRIGREEGLLPPQRSLCARIEVRTLRRSYRRKRPLGRIAFARYEPLLAMPALLRRERYGAGEIASEAGPERTSDRRR
jgi:hypothetical protein